MVRAPGTGPFGWVLLLVLTLVSLPQQMGTGVHLGSGIVSPYGFSCGIWPTRTSCCRDGSEKVHIVDSQQHAHYRKAMRSSGVGRRAGKQQPGGGDAASVAGGLGGAVLGGLLLGPFGAVFGAGLGSRWGRREADDNAAIEELGLDREMVELAKRVVSELASAAEDRDRVGAVRTDFENRVAQLDLDVTAKYVEAMEALKRDDEDAARQALEAKLSLQGRLDRARAELAKAEQRFAALDRSVAQLEQRAMEVSRLLERARRASGSERTSLAADASALGVSHPKDPLLEKFEALERGEQ